MAPDTEISQDGLRLVVFMPALNEEATVRQVIEGIPQRIPGVSSVQVLVIDDGSTDRTAAEAQAAGAVVVSHPQTRGLGLAFQTGVSRAIEMDADLIVNIDADGQFDPATIPALIAPVVDGRADFATASRFVDPALVPEMPRIKMWGNRMMAGLVSRLINQRFHDVSCGMRCYNRRAAMSLNTIGSFNYSQEAFLNLAFKGMRLTEVPIRVMGQRQHGQSRVASNLWRYGIQTLWIIFRSYRNYRPMRLFGRLAAGLMIPATALGLFLLVHYIRTGNFTPHKWAGFTGAAMLALGLMCLFMGVIGDMLSRHRIYLEEVLYHVRKRQSRDNGRGPL